MNASRRLCGRLASRRQRRSPRLFAEISRSNWGLVIDGSPRRAAGRPEQAPDPGGCRSDDGGVRTRYAKLAMNVGARGSAWSVLRESASDEVVDTELDAKNV